MSRWNDLIGALETVVRAATASPTALPSGADGWERQVRAGDRLNAGQFPHVCCDVVIEDAATLPHLQRLVTTRILMQLWTKGETLDQLETRVDAIEAALLTSYTVSGAVRDIAIVSKSVSDATSVGDAKRCATLILEAWKVL